MKIIDIYYRIWNILMKTWLMGKYLEEDRKISPQISLMTMLVSYHKVTMKS